MRLRHKKTGSIHELSEIEITEYGSLKEFNEDWEDAPKEPETYWYLDDCGSILRASRTDKNYIEQEEMLRKQLGNHFESAEEARKVKHKLEALRRLRKKGLKFEYWDKTFGHLFTIVCKMDGNADLLSTLAGEDLTLLFGREE